MAKLAGKAFRVKVSTTSGGSFTAVLAIHDGTVNLSGASIDVSEFGDTWMERLQGLKDASYDLKGFYNSADTTGQNVIQSAFLNDTPLFVEMLPDGTTGFKQQVLVSKYSVGSPVNGAISCDITLEGTAAVTLI
jgi:predicted secreted protein